MNSLRLLATRTPWVIFGVVWVWHGVAFEQRFAMGMN